MIDNNLKEACQTLPIFWPLKSFIATNPLWDLHHLGFQEALQKLKPLAHVNGVMPIPYYQDKYKNGEITAEDVFQACLICVKRCCDNLNLSDAAIQRLTNQWHETLLNENIWSDCSDITESNQHFLLISERIQIQANEKIVDLIKSRLFNFLMSYFDPSQNIGSQTHSADLFVSWQETVGKYEPKISQVLETLPSSRHAAIQKLLDEMMVEPKSQSDYLSRIVLTLIGWSSLIKWLEQRPDNPFVNKNATLSDVMLIWLCYEKAYCEKHISTLHPLSNSSGSNSAVNENGASLDLLMQQLIWQRALELCYERNLERALNRPPLAATKKTPEVQAVFCIDTRSEGVRRHLESVSNCDTYGYAGFFGFVFKYTSDDHCTSLQCPALFPPEALLIEQERIKKFVVSQFDSILNVAKNAKATFLPHLALVELTGVWYALSMLIKSFSAKSFYKIKEVLGQARDQNRVPNIPTQEVAQQFSIAEKTKNSINFLTAIGLVDNFAKIVFICGHGAQTENNPYQASFDCGACGGNSGFVNAIVMCSVLNDAVVRNEMRKFGINIPDTTYFVPGMHNTTRDIITISEDGLPEGHSSALARFRMELRLACKKLRLERTKELPGHFSTTDRSFNWSELIPEMGLINNAAIIIGPRALTKDVMLGRRVFLHSYEPSLDESAEILAAILQGPIVVAHWINAQYYFSTTDPKVYGAGNKMLHNVINSLGVIEGNLSDLKIGLPLQSIEFRGQILHEPLRLLVVIYAPKERVVKTLAAYPAIKAIFDGGWAHLKIIEPLS